MNHKYKIILFAYLLFLIGSASAQESNVTDYTYLKICNRTKQKIFAILAIREIFERKDWFLDGWYGVDGGKCIVSKKLSKGYMYIFAERPGASWAGTDRYFCVVSRAVYRKLFEDEKCISGEELRGFKEVLIQTDEKIYELFD